MRLLLGIVGLLVLAPAAGTARAQASTVDIEPWSLERMSEMGQALARQDRAAIAAGERLRRTFDGADPPGLIGSIVVADGDAQRVRFLVERDGHPRAGWDIVVSGSRTGAVVVPPDAPLSDDELAQFRARRTAAANVGAERCGRYNVFAVRDPENHDWLVWLLANANDLRTVPIDGHFRFRISADGLTLLRRDRLSAGCALHRRPPGTVQMILYTAGGTPPSEALVYVSIMHGFPISVEDSPTTFVVIDGAELERVTPRPRRRSRR